MRIIIKIAIIAIIFTRCAVPAPITKLTPSTIENKDYWNMGQQFVYASDKSVWFDCAYNRMENNKLIFDVKVTNMADTFILVDPTKFKMQVYFNDTFVGGENHAFDPEDVLLNLKISENVASAGAKNAATVGLISAILITGAAVAVAASADHSSDRHYQNHIERKENALSTALITNEVAQVAASSMAEESNIRADNNWTYRKSLAETFLRKTTIRKGFYIDGEVHFPYYPGAKWYRLVFSSGKSTADFLFKQKIIYPESVRVNTSYQ